MLVAVAYAVLSVVQLHPPRVLGATASHSKIAVPISDDLSITLLEAAMPAQEALVNEALSSTAPIGTKEDDPYGCVLWPAAQVVAASIAGLPDADVRDASFLELGAGTGLCSLTALARGASKALATDYREEPLALMRESALALPETTAGLLETQIFDIKGVSDALPNGYDYVVAADLLYMRSTSVALARRCVEALRAARPCKEVIVGDLGRPGRGAFLEELVKLGVSKERAAFIEVEGWMPGSPRHELVATTGASASQQSADDGATPVSVGLLRLKPDDLVAI